MVGPRRSRQRRTRTSRRAGRSTPGLVGHPVQRVVPQPSHLGGPGGVVHAHHQGTRRRAGPAGRARPSPAPRSPASGRTGGRARRRRMPSRLDRASSEAVERPRRPGVADRWRRLGLTVRLDGGARGRRAADPRTTLAAVHFRRGRQGGGQQGLAGRAARSSRARERWRVQFGEHVVEEQDRGRPQRAVASWWAASRRARASERCSPWEAWVRPGRPPGSARARRGGDRPW